MGVRPWVRTNCGPESDQPPLAGHAAQKKSEHALATPCLPLPAARSGDPRSPHMRGLGFSSYRTQRSVLSGLRRPPPRAPTPPEVIEAREREKELKELDRDTRTVFAYNLNLKADERDLFEFFSQAGEVRTVGLTDGRAACDACLTRTAALPGAAANCGAAQSNDVKLAACNGGPLKYFSAKVHTGCDGMP